MNIEPIKETGKILGGGEEAVRRKPVRMEYHRSQRRRLFKKEEGGLQRQMFLRVCAWCRLKYVR